MKKSLAVAAESFSIPFQRETHFSGAGLFQQAAEFAQAWNANNCTLSFARRINGLCLD